MAVIGILLLAVGLIVMVFGFRRGSVRNSKSNVNQTYAETGVAAPLASAKSFEDRFLAWGGFMVALAGLVVSLLPACEALRPDCQARADFFGSVAHMPGCLKMTAGKGTLDTCSD